MNKIIKIYYNIVHIHLEFSSPINEEVNKFIEILIGRIAVLLQNLMLESPA